MDKFKQRARELKEERLIRNFRREIRALYNDEEWKEKCQKQKKN